MPPRAEPVELTHRSLSMTTAYRVSRKDRSHESVDTADSSAPHQRIRGRGPGLQDPAPARRDSSRVFDPAMVRMATMRSFVMLDPRIMMRNPGHVPRRGRHRPDRDRHRPVDRHRRGHRPDRLPGGADPPAPAHGAVRQLRRGPGRGPRQGAGRQPPGDPPGHAGLSPRQPRVAGRRDRLLHQAAHRRPRRWSRPDR